MTSPTPSSVRVNLGDPTMDAILAYLTALAGHPLDLSTDELRTTLLRRGHSYREGRLTAADLLDLVCEDLGLGEAQ